ncbi:MAG: hypothetical protein LUE11_00275 [Clostridia bacterium]|nr:hypothetical protein [Clostridia bacterium]
MKTVKTKLRAGFLAVMLALILGAGIPAVPAQAAGGAVYTCSITGCYVHPVTGVIEDSGGEAGYDIAQPMVSNVVCTSGILEVTDSGQYYVTVRLSLMDYTSNHQFWVQNVGDSGWMTGAVGTTGSGTDGNGTTADFCIQVPSENCVIRCSMYVEPMGRSVIFYFYPSNYAEGNQTDMNATIVTASADSNTASSSESTSTTSGTTSGSSTTSSTGTTSGSTSTGTGSTSLQSSTSGSTSTDQSSTENTDNVPTLESSLTTDSGLTSAALDTEGSSDDSTLSEAEGLSLSTAGDTGDDSATTSRSSSTSTIFAIAAAFTSSALILICAVAGLIYFFRKNWYRWGGGEYDDD